jgi:hypothetical protein
MPTAIRSYQNDDRKYAKTKDVFLKRKEMVLEKDISEHNREQLILWRTFWIRNIHRFILDAMEVKLYPFQIIWVYLMQISPLFVAICSRTASKSFLLGCFSVARSILYPGLSTIIAATTKEQAGRIISKKITWLYNNSPLCQAEIKSLTANNNLYECVFHNGSTITVVAANEGALGNRCNDLIIDEYAQVDKTTVDEILKPFLFPWQAPYLQNSEYENLIEPIRLYYISSAWYANEWWKKTADNIAKQMAEGKPAGFFATDFLCSLKHNLKTVQQIEDEKRDNASFDMQYGNIPGRENLNSFFQANMFKRNIRRAFYPIRKLDYGLKKNPFNIPKSDTEIRILGIDLSARKSQHNDNSVIACIKLEPSKNGYERSLLYLESSQGEDHITQASRIKDIYYDFQADYIVMDIANVGIDMFVDLSMPYYNEERGINVPAFTVMNRLEISPKAREDLRGKTRALASALPIVFPISGTDDLNTDIHVAFRSSLQKKLWNFLVDDIEAEDFLIKHVKEFTNSADDTIRTFMLHPFVQMNLFLSETLNLEYIPRGNNIKLDEGTGRKDRYSAVSYANYFCSILDKDILKEEDASDEWSVISGLTQVW